MGADIVRFSWGCRCGGAAIGHASKGALAEVERIWREAHTTSKCEPCDAKTAGRIRRAQERKGDSNG